LLQQNFWLKQQKNSFVVPSFVAVIKPFFSVHGNTNPLVLVVPYVQDVYEHFQELVHICLYTGKNGFVTAAILGTTNNYFVAATKNFAAKTKRFVDRTKRLVVVTYFFCYPYFNK